MFTTANDSGMIELVEKNQAVKIHLPDNVQDKHMLHSLVVFAVGKDVTLYEVGDEVLTPLPTENQLARIDVDGSGEKVFIFWAENDIFGKFTEGEA